MSRGSRAQTGLEHLLTYGWAIIAIATIVGVLAFILSTPAQEVTFSVTDPIKFLLKGGTVSGATAQIKVQNITGGNIIIQKITMSSGYNGCSLNGIAISSNPFGTSIPVPAGGEILIECSSVTQGTGEILLEYEDYAGLKRKIGIKSIKTGEPGQPGQENCGNGIDDDADLKVDCDDSGCNANSDCEMWCTTNNGNFPVKGGIKLAEYHESQQTGNCLSALLDGRIIFLRNLSGQALNISNASVSIGTAQHFGKYLQTSNCAAMGEFSSPECPEVDGLGGYREGFLIPTINGIAGAGEDCALPPVAVQDGGEIQIETSEFYLCPVREYDCPYATEEMWRTHKSNPITITLSTSIGAINVYCYNFPILGSGPAQCTNGQQRGCPLQQGICAGAKETCAGGTWPGCNAATYGALYETTETSCTDLRDNDCDGKTDCDDADCSGSDDCKIYATTNDWRFPVKGGITIAYTEINGCIEVIDHLQPGNLPATNPLVSYLQPQTDNRCVNWPIDGDTIYLLNQSGVTLNVNSASVSLGSNHFNEYTADSCTFWGRFSSDRCLDSDSGEIGGFSESFGVTSINGVQGSTQNCNINTSISVGQEIRIGVSPFSYCANRDYSLPPDCNCQTDVLLREHKDNPITIALNTDIGTINIYLYNFPTDQ